jgi:hypothetical protein
LKFSKLRFARLTEKFGKSGYQAVTLKKKFNKNHYEENNLFNPITHDCWP